MYHQPPEDWPQRLASADAIYISHSHPDHLNTHTLKVLAQKKRDIPIFVPRFKSNTCESLLENLGFENIRTTPFDTWIQLDEKLQIMILQDASGREDSGLIIDYKGHITILTVDSANLNSGHLPQGVDLLLTSFAAGASGFPSCWEEQYPIGEIEKKVSKTMSSHKKRVLDYVSQCKPKTYIPYAGYFTEAHPLDKKIKKLNRKNTPDEICDYLKKNYKDLNTVVPEPGLSFDIGHGTVRKHEKAVVEKSEYDFEKYTLEIDSANSFGPLKTLEGVRAYFNWAGFQGDLVLHVVEMDDTFSSVIREYYMDFSLGELGEKKPEIGEKRYLRMKVRSNSYRFVLKNGLPWEEISIGFQCQFYREPDTYNFDFWDHFQNKLPQVKPFS